MPFFISFKNYSILKFMKDIILGSIIAIIIMFSALAIQHPESLRIFIYQICSPSESSTSL